MPTFRTRPSNDLSTSIRNLVRSGAGPTAADLMSADAAAATFAQRSALAEKARLESEQMRAEVEARNNPRLATEFASHSAGINLDEGERLSNHIRGVLEQPTQADIDDAEITGSVAMPFRTAEPVLAAGQGDRFRSALAAQVASRLATGKTNADQLTQAAGNVADNAIISQAVNAADLPTQNRLVSAVARKVHEPYVTNAQGTVLNKELGTLNEGGRLASAHRGLTTARTGTEGSRQAELGTRKERNTALAELARARATAVGAGRSATPLAPQRITRMIDMSAATEFRAKKAAYDALPRNERLKTLPPTFDAVRSAVEARYREKSKRVDLETEREDALEAIVRGADPEAVAARFKQQTGIELDLEEGD